jgi:hypothetical protein
MASGHPRQLDPRGWYDVKLRQKPKHKSAANTAFKTLQAIGCFTLPYPRARQAKAGTTG